MSNKLFVVKCKHKQSEIGIAVKCEEPNAPADIAKWCRGKYCIAGLHGAGIMLYPYEENSQYARYGDYIVKDLEGNFNAYSPDEFKKHFETL